MTKCCAKQANHQTITRFNYLAPLFARTTKTLSLFTLIALSISAMQSTPPTISAVTTTNVLSGCAVTPTTPQNSLPIGPYCASVSGSGFSQGAQVTVGGRPVAVLTVPSATQLTIAGAGVVAWDGTSQPVVVSTGTAPSQPFQVLVGTPNAKATWAAASRFLEQAAFGPKYSDVIHVQQVGLDAWITEQSRWRQSPPYGTVNFQYYNGYPARFFYNAVNAPDQLRQKMTFALSQFFVVSANNTVDGNVAWYYNMLYNLAFTNYPTLLAAVTTSPAMGDFLNMAGNEKASGGVNGTQPNQNYGREVLQLFSIGTTLLDSTATPITVNGIGVPTYTQNTIVNFSRVFTGWTINNENYSVPMVASNLYHDTDITLQPKTLLSLPGGPTLPYETTTNGDVVIELGQALANIESHPNVAPFVSKFLIQHFVTSNPSPAYVQRVGNTFHQTNGNMMMVLRAILMDREARAGDVNPDANSTFGHLKEPALWVASLCRAFNTTVVDQVNGLDGISAGLGQPIFYPPSVFNFYSSHNPLPPSLGEQPGLLGPEFQIEGTSTAYYRLEETEQSGLAGGMWDSILYTPYGTTDLTPYVAIVGIPDLFVDALDAAMTHGQMPDQMKTIIMTELANPSWPTAQTAQAIQMIADSSYYEVSH